MSNKIQDRIKTITRKMNAIIFELKEIDKLEKAGERTIPQSRDVYHFSADMISLKNKIENYGENYTAIQDKIDTNNFSEFSSDKEILNTEEGNIISENTTTITQKSNNDNDNVSNTTKSGRHIERSYSSYHKKRDESNDS